MMLKTLFNYTSSIFFLIILYVFIYSPYLRIINMGVGKIFVFVAFLYYFYNTKALKYILLFKYEIALVLLLILYSFITSLWGDGSSSIVPYLHIQFVVDCLLVPIVLYNVFKRKIDFTKLNVYLVYVGLIASLITIFLILNPLFNIYLRENIIIDDLDTGTVQDSIRYIRGFTFSDSSTFGYGITQGIIFGLALNETKTSKKYFIPMILLLISILVNARVGFAVAIIGLVLLHKRIKISFILFSLSISVFILLFFSNSDFIDENSQTINWATSFFTETFDFFSGTKGNGTTFDALTDMLFLPENPFGLFFGEGRIIMGKIVGSDIGYINQIYTGGFLYLFILIATLLFICYNIYKLDKNIFLSIFILTILLFVNLKGTAMFVSLSFLRLFFLIYVVMKCMDYEITNNMNSFFHKEISN